MESIEEVLNNLQNQVSTLNAAKTKLDLVKNAIDDAKKVNANTQKLVTKIQTFCEKQQFAAATPRARQKNSRRKKTWNQKNSRRKKTRKYRKSRKIAPRVH